MSRWSSSVALRFRSPPRKKFGERGLRSGSGVQADEQPKLLVHDSYITRYYTI